ncbi:MAG: protein translocase subunit SecF [Gemmatimonadota bacterium]|nr:protein translocase subunit SecF [Gemmatimonadota bacterium]MDH3366316.1 protein translocase subunit SecF [Gemmatimonadota bacterium]MDH3477056.1 protein translocase subunit SecF [Gemmatimonadota bacterium]MDH3570881.1 protein translocase subunit SecF [Gemmatimonadota bacterium]MDH5550174.1 protein translocase subunit SecF [Gemmatimonadota bacterium]
MFRLFDDAHYDVMAHWKSAMVVTSAFLIPGLIVFAFRGLNSSIEFTGGTLIQVHAVDESIQSGTLRSALAAQGLSGTEIQTFGAPNEFVIRARLDPRADVSEETTQETEQTVRQALSAAFSPEAFEIVRTEAVGPKVGSELRERATLALLLAFGATFLVLWFRYEWRFGFAAVVASIHDIVTTLAFVSYLNLEISLMVVAALLTLIGYSLNDTIVTFDRVRENIKKTKRGEYFYHVLNRSINETLPRTILTSGTTFGAVLALLILGGSVIRPFAWVMAFGIFTGTFSSIFIASPILLGVERRWPSDAVKVMKPGERPVPATT